MSAGWTTLELDIVDALTRRVRLLSDEQICDLWSSSVESPDALRRAIDRLCAGRLLHRTIVNAHPRLSVEAPLIAWAPGAARPSFAEVLPRIRKRWNQPAMPTKIYSASTQAANLFGASALNSSPFMRRDHDLLLGEVFVFYRTRRPDRAEHWLGEAAIAKAGSGVKNQDAVLLGNDGRPPCVIESAGNARRKHIESFHRHCAEHSLPYELW
jgi:hypothetical protein